MLGFNESRQIVEEPFVSELREALRRAQSGEMTEKEQSCDERLKAARSNYNFIWQ